MSDQLPPLQPCPFCGEEAKLTRPHGYLPPHYIVTCKCCEARTGWDRTEPGAIGKWNARAIAPCSWKPEPTATLESEEKKAEAFEWLRALALSGNRHACVAIFEWVALTQEVGIHRKNAESRREEELHGVPS